MTCGATSGSCTYTSSAGQTGTDTFTYKVNDGTVDGTVATVTVQLTNMNGRRNAQSTTASRRVATAITLTGSDANLDTLTYTVVTQPTKGSLSCTAAGLHLHLHRRQDGHRHVHLQRSGDRRPQPP